MTEEETKPGEVKVEKKPKREINKWKIISMVLIIILAVSFLVFGTGITGMTVSTSDNTLGSEEAVSKVIGFINENLVSEGELTLVSTNEISGMYNVTFSYQDTEGSLYVTKDGNFLLLPNGGWLNIPDFEKSKQEAQQETQEQQPEEVIKTDRPEAHAFIMSYCPYGLQFLKAYIPVIELLGDKADLQVNFVHYVMHGEKEMTENTRIYCIQKDHKDKLTDYLRCFVENDDPEGCMSEAGISKSSVEMCMQQTDEEFDITKTFEESEQQFPPYPIDATLANQYGVGGSPTFVVNGVTLSVNRSPESIKQEICSAFNTPPVECEQTLSTQTEAPGIGPLESGSDSGSSGTC